MWGGGWLGVEEALTIVKLIYEYYRKGKIHI
jgi:hypothetical protein